MPADTDPTFTTGEQIGDYLIGKLISKGTNTSTWHATQTSVKRQVVLCTVDAEHSDNHEFREQFIADVRAKASVKHPLIASILEAVNEGSLCYFAMEKLTGKHLGDLHDKGWSIAPIYAVRIIRDISGACQYLEEDDIPTLPLSPHDIFVDDKYHCRITNMTICGELDHSVPPRDKEMVGHLIDDMVDPNQPGATRTNALLGYMADLGRKDPLSWQRIHNLSSEIERQLATPGEHGQISSSTMRLNQKSIWQFYLSTPIGKFLFTLIILSIIGGIAYYLNNSDAPPKKRQMVDMVHIPAGKHPGPNGTHVKMKGLWIDAHEVSIAEYAEFLEFLNELKLDMRVVYEHKDQPTDKTSHLPDDWENLYATAQQGGVWNKLNVDLNYPVVGVDWWDAHAYAEWKGRRLPTHEEWYLACSSGSNPAKLMASGWTAVDHATKTAHGLHGMAGNVSEWMREKNLNPADPSQPPRYMITGASYMKPKFGARAREWVEDRSLRRPDLGFRTCTSRRQED